ncbi:MAG: phage minor head protein [Alphaproteobacteria bacterium]|nr:phage minor head protein [Alphaproteobacteria bacterium]
MAPPLVELKPLPFREAIAALGRRTGNLKPSDRWTDRMHDEHAGEFTVARSLGYDILGDIEAAMNKALAEGTTLADFSKTLTPVLKAKGWWGKVESDDGTVVQLGSQRRLETIFNTNMRTSYAAGRWEQIQRTKADLPYLMYSAVLDKRTRPAHRSWHGTVLHVDDP